MQLTQGSLDAKSAEVQQVTAELSRRSAQLEAAATALEAEQAAHTECQRSLAVTAAQLQRAAQLVKDSMLGMEVLARAMRQLEAEQAGHPATRAALPQEQEAHTACKQALAEVAAELEECEAELDAKQRAHSSIQAGLDKEQSQHAETREKFEQFASLLRAVLRQRRAEATREAGSAIS
jgi:chromosome segregation ATPase